MREALGLQDQLALEIADLVVGQAVGRLAGGDIYQLQLADRLNEPRLTQWDAWGKRIDRIDEEPGEELRTLPQIIGADDQRAGDRADMMLLERVGLHRIGEDGELLYYMG